MDDLRQRIIKEVKKRRAYAAELFAFERLMRRNVCLMTNENVELLKSKVAMIDAWIEMLPADYAYVVKRHLVDGVEWEFVTFEYQKIWGYENARSTRTLKRFQTKALDIIEAYVNRHISSCEGLLGD